MSGHSKWSTIKRKKAKVDAERGKVFTKLIKEITIAARLSGGDIDSNPRLRTAVEVAKGANMPSANIDRAIKKGTGDLPGVIYEESIYEGYGPGGTALYIETTTDNKNRTVSEIRHILSKHGGNLGNANSVAWMFERKGMIVTALSGKNEDEMLVIAMDGGADDLAKEDRSYVITCAVDKLNEVRSTLEEQGITVDSATLIMVPKNTVKVEGKDAEQLLKLISIIEDHDDVQNVYTNFDIDESILESFDA